MPGGRGNIKGHEGNTFSKENQPKKRRGVSLVSKLKAMLKEDPERVTKIIEAMLVKAEEGDLKAIDMVMDRVDNKPKQALEVLEGELQPLTFKVIGKDDKPT